MKKYLNAIILFCISFMFMNDVHAVTCGEIDTKITNYNSYKEQLSKVDCNNPQNESEVSICNDSNMQKNIIVTELMKLNDEGGLDSCPSNKNAAVAIISENESKCGKIFDDFFTDLVKRVMIIFYVAGPILLILFGTLDYTKVIFSGNTAAGMKRANKRFISRVIATILLFMAPLIVNIILSLNQTDYYLSGNSYACDFSMTNYETHYKMTNVIPESTPSGGGGSSEVSTEKSTIKVKSKDTGKVYKFTSEASYVGDGQTITIKLTPSEGETQTKTGEKVEFEVEDTKIIVEKDNSSAKNFSCTYTVEDSENYEIDKSEVKTSKKKSSKGKKASGINFTTNYSGVIYKGGPLPIPFQQDNFTLGSPFGMRFHPILKVNKMHNGVDLTARYNGSLDAPIVSVADGTVTLSAGGCVKGNTNCNGRAGNYVIVAHNIDGNKFNSVYMHLKTNPLVKVGQKVTAGTKIGIQGSTGGSTGEHLHFGIQVNGSYVDPYPYITGKPSK